MFLAPAMILIDPTSYPVPSAGDTVTTGKPFLVCLTPSCWKQIPIKFSPLPVALIGAEPDFV